MSTAIGNGRKSADDRNDRLTIVAHRRIDELCRLAERNGLNGGLSVELAFAEGVLQTVARTYSGIHHDAPAVSNSTSLRQMAHRRMDQLIEQAQQMGLYGRVGIHILCSRGALHSVSVHQFGTDK